MRWCALLSLVAIFSSQAAAVFADEAFQIDYHHALLGLPLSHATYFHQPQSSSNASLLYTVSDKAILGAINPKDGSLLWRQILAQSSTQEVPNPFLVTANDGKVVSGCGSKISAWDALNGRLIWTRDLPTGETIFGLVACSQVRNEVEGGIQDIVALYGLEGRENAVTRISGDGSEAVWNYIDRSGDEPLAVAVSDDHVYFISKSTALLSAGKIKVTVLHVNNGDVVKSYTPSMGSEALDIGRQHVTGSGSKFPLLVSTDSPFTSIKFNVLGTTKSSTVSLEDKGEVIERLIVHFPERAAKPHILVEIQGKSRHWAEVFHFNPKTGDFTRAYSLPATAETSVFTASSVGETVYFTRMTDTESILWSSESHGQLGRWPRRGSSAKLETAKLSTTTAHAVAEVVARGKTGIAIRVVELSSGGDFTLTRNGETQWTRPEILADAVFAAWADEVDQGDLVAELQAEVSSNPVMAYIHRVRRHAHNLSNLPQAIQRFYKTLSESLFQTPGGKAGSVPKNMVGEKTVVVATSRQEILAVDAVNGGTVKWRVRLPDIASDSNSLVALNVLQDRITGYLADGSFVVMDLHDGHVIEQKSGKIPIARIVEVNGHPGSTFVKVDLSGTPQLAVDYSPSTATEGNALVTISKDGKALGWSVGQSIENTWTLSPVGFEIVSAAARPAHDPVASIGKVLGDRSVLYKYLSPNLVLLTAVSKSSKALTMYLVDAVTGATLHTSSHEGVDVSSVIPSVMSENWFAYSFSAKDPGSLVISNYLVVSELLESTTPNDRGQLGQTTNYSSFAPGSSTTPHVISQAFTIAEPISHMSVSQTSQGITVRQLNCVLPNSGAIIGIPRHLLDPRRTVDRDPTSLEMEEGLVKYSPVLDLDPKLFLTHSREVFGIKKLISSPTLLESTSLVFGFGHDIFGTQVSPSMAFDVLGKGFNKVSLILTVVALWAGVMFLAPMARSRQVEGRWKG